MNKKIRVFLSILLLAAMLGSLMLPSLAVEEEKEAEPAPVILHIRSVDDFMRFSKKCVRDIYSQNLIVYLDTDLDLSDQDFNGVPTFSGTLEGQRHSITGLNLTEKGSQQGLFRYLTKTAVIKDLTVKGNVLPEGSRQEIGGIAGSNSGIIRDCHFEGESAGSESVGGLVGINRVSGILEACTASGAVHGVHFVGGLAGKNLGTIRGCKNQARINHLEEYNTIKPNTLQQVTVDTDLIRGKESAVTVTDLGGIAGTSSGVIRDCVNHAEVGYPRMGYNIGGIAGSQQGYLKDCKNYGRINGRKEVSGIVGQLEPVVDIDYSEDTLQILRGQLDATSALANRASYNIQSGAEGVRSDIQNIHSYAGDALEAVDILIPSFDDSVVNRLSRP